MPDLTNIKDYDIHVYWDSRAEYFVAEVQDISTCAADGATQSEALANLEETFAVLKEAYAEDKLHFPKPSPGLPITIGELSAISDVVKISRLAELSGIPGQTLATKMRRGTELSTDESRRVARAFDAYGLALKPPGGESSQHMAGEKPIGDYSFRTPGRLAGKIQKPKPGKLKGNDWRKGA